MPKLRATVPVLSTVKVRVRAAASCTADPKSVPSELPGVASPSAMFWPKPCTTTWGAGDTVPVTAKLKGFLPLTFVAKLIWPANVPTVAVLNCTVSESLAPAAIVALSGSAIV